jgi:hypothetical protein
MLGWWSLSGLIFTPAYMIYNMYEAIGKRKKVEPSQALRKIVSRQIAANVMRSMKTSPEGPEGGNSSGSSV